MDKTRYTVLLFLFQQRHYAQVIRYFALLASECHEATLLEVLAECHFKLRNRDASCYYWRQLLAYAQQSTLLLNKISSRALNLADYDLAIESCQHSLRLAAQQPSVQFRLGTLYLLLADYPKGWPLYAARLQLPEQQNWQQFARERQWCGKDLNNKTLLVVLEQGLGDSIQFGRYLAVVQQQYPQVKLILYAPAQQLEDYTFLFAEHRVVAYGVAVQGSYWLPLLSLPQFYTQSNASIPPPLTIAVRQQVARNNSVVASDKKQVGLAWFGNPQHSRDAQRSLRLSQLEQLPRCQDMTYHCLHHQGLNHNCSNISPKLGIIDHCQHLHSLADTATLMQTMDLVITVDTATAHLAASLGIRTWILLAYAADWRWQQHQQRSPWYSSVRLFRQQRMGDWSTVMVEVAKALQECDYSACS